MRGLLALIVGAHIAGRPLRRGLRRRPVAYWGLAIFGALGLLLAGLLLVFAATQT